MLEEYKVDLWNAINKYTESCGGDTSNRTISDNRMNAVVDIERIVHKIRSENNYGMVTNK